jgi:hydroxysqualene dehydroxylase
MRVGVVGGGYAGLACAVELADAGCTVEVFEASRTLGGRARAVEADGVTLDNGAHILIGAYRETLRLMEKVGAGDTALQRHPLRLDFPGKISIEAPPLPAPLHLAWALLAADGLSWREKVAAIRFMRALQKARFRLPRDITAKQLIANQPPVVRHFLWEPLCLAALNTPVNIASAQVFLNVLRDTLAADRAASDLLLPATDFSALFPDPAARYVEAHGGRVHRSRRIQSLEELAGFDQRVLAVAPYHLPPLLSSLPECADVLRQVEGFTWQPIVTVYLQYPPDTRLPFAMAGVEGGHAQWLFDRGALCGQAGWIAAVISGAGPHQQLSQQALAQAVYGEVARLLPGLTAPLQTRVIEEKRATFACTPGLDRPTTATPLPNLWLAGDYVASDYPATLEGAIRSGVAAARAILS